jgi:hypothetical protein
VGDEALAVRPDFYGLARRLCLHLPGVLLGRCEWVGKPHSQDPRGRSRRVPQVLAGGSGLDDCDRHPFMCCVGEFGFEGGVNVLLECAVLQVITFFTYLE